MSEALVRPNADTDEGQDAHDAKRAAMSYLDEAFAEARHDGIDADCVAHAALFAALASLVDRYGEEAVARYTEGLAGKIHEGCYSILRRH